MKTALEKLFGFDSAKHSVRTEIMAGITSLLTMAYILAVNPSIFSALPDMSGGSSYSAVDGASNPVTLTPNGGDSYTLTMPASDVTISAN